MKRRTFFSRLFGSLGLAAAAPAVAASARTVLIQESPIAGFEFHRGAAVWSSLHVGQMLELVREPTNPHDADAVAVYFQEEKLGYVPRAENHAVAQMLDRGEHLEASIVKLSDGEDPWNRIHISISLM
jgi:hypothetical protein